MNQSSQWVPWMVLLAITCVPAASGGQPRLRASFDKDGVLISAGKNPVLFYQRVTKSLDGKWPRAAYVHPLYDLGGGVITEDFPSDHRHHRGIFWAWHQVWLGDKKLGDPWVCENFVWDVQSITTMSPANRLSLVAKVDWKSPDYVDGQQQMIPIVEETTRITVHEADESSRVIDFEISLLALADGIRIGGSDDEKGYGGFSPRIKLNDRQRFMSSNGEVEPTKKAIDAGPWIDIVDETSGLAMISHSQNPGTLGAWILRRQRSMQNPVFPGRQPVALLKEKPTLLRYRLVIHDGNLSSDKITSLEQEFSRSSD
jgi:hypothetical protein